MQNKIQGAFNEIMADEALLEKTAAYLRMERKKHKYSQSHFRSLRWAGVFAAIIMLVAGVFSHNIYFTAAAYVSIDVNPSVELTLNRFDRVIGCYAFNADGDRLIQETSLSGKKYYEALSILVTQMVYNGYFNDSPLVSMTVQTTDGEKELVLCDTLRQVMDAQVNAIQGAMDLEVFPISAEVRGNAYGCNMSPSKYLAIQELLEVDETATLEQYSQSSVRQIRHRTQQCRAEHDGMKENLGENESDQDKSQKQQQGYGQSHNNGHHGNR